MKDQKAILFFLLKFVGLYVVLNTVYGLWISSYAPLPDPITKVVTHQSVACISITEKNISIGSVATSPNVPILKDGRAVVNVYEGCNGLNVMFVFLSFVIAYTGTLWKTAWFCVVGLVLIYIFNLFRVSLLYFIAEYYPNNLYFFHKYLFTGVLYGIVFVLWYFWVRKVWPTKA
ncbi:MAG: exosortase family protein XrtF [Bacteroidota bacterium]